MAMPDQLDVCISRCQTSALMRLRTSTRGGIQLHEQGSKEEQRKLIQSLYTVDSTFSHPFVDCMVSEVLLVIATT